MCLILAMFQQDTDILDSIHISATPGCCFWYSTSYSISQVCSSYRRTDQKILPDLLVGGGAQLQDRSGWDAYCILQPHMTKLAAVAWKPAPQTPITIHIQTEKSAPISTATMQRVTAFELSFEWLGTHCTKLSESWAFPNWAHDHSCNNLSCHYFHVPIPSPWWQRWWRLVLR